MISFEVLGTPAPKGSMRAVMFAGRAQVIPGGSKANQRAQNAWSKAIRTAVKAAIVDPRMTAAIGEADPVAPLYVDRPLEVHLLFKLVRPGDHYGRRRGVRYVKDTAPLHPMVQRDDIDKLARAVLDALTGLLYDDDGRIVTLVCTKQYAESEALQGVVITIDALPLSMQSHLQGVA